MGEELEIDATVGAFLGETIHRYDFGMVRLLFYRVHWDGSEIRSNDHEACAWVRLDELTDYDFAPADWSFVKRLMSGDCEVGPEA